MEYKITDADIQEFTELMGEIYYDDPTASNYKMMRDAIGIQMVAAIADKSSNIVLKNALRGNAAIADILKTNVAKSIGYSNRVDAVAMHGYTAANEFTHKLFNNGEDTLLAKTPIDVTNVRYGLNHFANWKNNMVNNC